MKNYILESFPQRQRNITLNDHNMACVASDLLRLGLVVPSHIMTHWHASIHYNSYRVNDMYLSYFNKFLSRYGVKLCYCSVSTLRPFYRPFKSKGVRHG